jgi:hypothetical protein
MDNASEIYAIKINLLAQDGKELTLVGSKAVPRN